MKSEGLISKWNYHNSIVYNDARQSNDVTVGKFKIFGPLPESLIQSNKLEVFNDGVSNPIYPTPSNSKIREGWFTVIGHLLPSGILNLLIEEDNTLIYSVNITSLFSSEIKILHHSILQTSNVLFVGFINELRESHGFSSSPNKPFILDDKYKSITRILIDFDLKNNLEDWFVVLSSYTQLEYVGNPFLNRQLKVSQDISLEIMEAQLIENLEYLKGCYLYCELVIWSTPWFRSAIVKVDNVLNIFWKELIKSILPISGSNHFKILIKKSNDQHNYNSDGEDSDEIIGSCFLNLDLFEEDQFLQRIPILNLQNKSVGNLMINLSVTETNVLPAIKYKSFEKILKNSKINSLISYLEPKLETKNLESNAAMLLDIYQSLNREDEYFEALMKYELSSTENLLLDNNESLKQQTLYRYNTIFRGNSILSKSLEQFTIRVGHEYLEKLLGGFINKIQEEDLNCECDPKYEPENYLENYNNLLGYVEYLWNKIYTTTNDIPDSIKRQWKNLRNNVELSIDVNDNDIPLNALSSFIFLRFICPAILNPKLYNLSKTHYSGKISRTLVLIAKVLMVFSNRTLFQKHREPYLMKLNADFILKHREEVLIYFDKVSFKKMDFNEKLLNMSTETDRIQFGSRGIFNELPSMPYLIEKYLNFAKLCELMSRIGQGDKKDGESEESVDLYSYQIEGFDETELEEDFLTSVMKEEHETLNNLLPKHEFTLKDIEKQSKLLVRETTNVENLLTKPETPQIYVNNPEIEKNFVDSIVRSLKFETGGNTKTLVTDNEVFHNSQCQIDALQRNDLNYFFNSLELESKKKITLTKRSSFNSVSRSVDNSASSDTKESFSVAHNRNTIHNYNANHNTDSASNNNNNNHKDKKSSSLFKSIFRRRGSD